MNDMRPTHIAHLSSSVLDLVLASGTASANTASYTTEDTLGSDHYPLMASYNSGLAKPSRLRRSGTRINSKRINWNDYTHSLNETVQENTSLEALSVQMVQLAAIMEGKKCTQNSSRPPCPWWDEDCSRAVAKRKRLLRIYHQTKRFEHLLAAKHQMAETKRLLKEKKMAIFRSFCESISRETSAASIWRKIRSFNRKAPIENPLENGDKKWRQYFLVALTPPSVEPEIVLLPEMTTHHDLTKPLTLAEFELAIKHTKDTAVGPDRVSYPMMKNLSIRGKESLVRRFNEVLASGDIPDSWKEAYIVPILLTDHSFIMYKKEF
ncbi:PREDICTED: uncharacterized protein LOC108565595 [Nicrophorus vespilloides]|uniref:Uncharacterized protein LOC108565595 n=1 Tax=Nicrophorus vespilloides TaxID=110193 RepID=A0ABM1N1C5_NICVS|nr:PREDICTED: uncharacterized protein LOC108565595 [Nicrophorus vespilloides]